MLCTLFEIFNLTAKDMWGDFDVNCWFKAVVKVPEEYRGKKLRLDFQTSRSGWDASNPQFLLFTDGTPVQGLDINHRDYLLDNDVDSFCMDLQAYTSRLSCDKIPAAGRPALEMTECSQSPATM